MKRNRVKEAVAIAMCACTMAGSAAHAQLVIGSGPVSQSSYTAGSLSELSSADGSFIVNRFGVRDGRLVAYGRVVPTESESGLGVSSGSGVSGSASGSLSIGSSSSSVGRGTVLRWGGSSSAPFDASRLGSWTGIGTGYGESGVESRSNMTSDYDGPVSSMNLSRPSSEDGFELRMGPTGGNDRVGSGIDLRFGPTSGNDRVGGGIDLQAGPTSGNDRVGAGIDVQMGATSGNDRTRLDGSMGATSANDRTLLDGDMGATSANDRTSVDASFGSTSRNDRSGIELQFGPTSGNDRVASDAVIDVQMGATSGNDRTMLDGNLGATSGNDRTSIDASFGPTSGNDRTLLDGNMGATSGNDRTVIDARMGATSSNDRTSLVDVDLNANTSVSSPLVRLGGSQTLYSSEESSRAYMVSASSEDIAVPVTVVSASCDAVSLSIGGTQPLVVTSSSGADSDVLCGVSEASASGDSQLLLKHLNRLVSESR